MSEVLEWLQKTEENAVNYCAKLLPKDETPQDILFWKLGVLRLLEMQDKENFYTLRHGDKFGFSELLVNKLMQFSLRARIGARY